MIIFYKKDTGEIIGTIDGRIHDKIHMQCCISSEGNEKNVEKYIIGWEETNEIETYEVEVEKMVEVGKNLFKKVKSKEKMKRTKKIEHNLDKFEILQRFENITSETPLDYKVDLETGNLIKK